MLVKTANYSVIGCLVKHHGQWAHERYVSAVTQKKKSTMGRGPESRRLHVVGTVDKKFLFRRKKWLSSLV
jgi:hypothetical protein